MLLRKAIYLYYDGAMIIHERDSKENTENAEEITCAHNGIASKSRSQYVL